jgi:hypothetical protein
VLVDRAGWFEFADVPESYDLTIAEGGGRFITAYFGLTRRDPMVTHTARGESHQAKQDHHADIEGVIDAAPTATAEQVARPAVCFLSPSTVANGSLVGYQHNHGQYRVCAGWDGLASISGVLVALARADGKAYLAKQPLTIVDGRRIHPNRGDDKLRADLRLEPVAMGQIAGSAPIFTRKIQIRSSEEKEREILKIAYAVPGTFGLINLGDCESKEDTFVCQVPDLGALGGEYCLAIVPSADSKTKDLVPGPRRQVDIHANRCGGKFGMTNLQIHRAPSPDIGEGAFNFGPDSTRMFTRDTLAWKVADDADEPLYQLDLGSCAEESCLVAYLNKSTFSWADFERTGMTYLRGSSLLVSVSAFYPSTSVDELAASVWRFSDRTTWQRTDSRMIPIFLADPPKRPPSARSPKQLGVQDLAELPTCAAMMKAHSIGDLDAAMDDQRISARGILGFDFGTCIVLDRGHAYGSQRQCSSGCTATLRLDNPESTDHHLVLRQQRAPMRTDFDECTPVPRALEVIASGILVARAPNPRLSEHREEYTLDDVVLCAVRQERCGDARSWPMGTPFAAFGCASGTRASSPQVTAGSNSGTFLRPMT